MRKLLLAVLLLPTTAKADSLLSLPGMADAVAKYAKEAKAVGLVDLNGHLSGGGFLPIRTLHDSENKGYLAFGPGGAIKEGQHFKGGFLLASDLSNVVRKLESRWSWYDSHTSKVTLPDLWLGFGLLPPLDSEFRWDRWKEWFGASVSIGF